MAWALEVSVRAVWDWLSVARCEGRLSARTPARTGVSADVCARLVVWGGCVAAVHRELVAEASSTTSVLLPGWSAFPTVLRILGSLAGSGAAVWGAVSCLYLAIKMNRMAPECLC